MNKKSLFNLSLTMGLFIGGSMLPIKASTVGISISDIGADKRPTQAKVIETYDKPKGWYAQALTGLQPPYPSNFRFLEDQEAWYTPFIEPGMRGRYDIRGWHEQ
jgi:hypothetical protein